MQVDKLADMKTQLSLASQEFSMINDKIDELKQDIKDLNESVKLSLRVFEGVYATKESVKELDKKILEFASKESVINMNEKLSTLYKWIF